MDIKCSICGEFRRGIAFKTGYVCENCLKYIRNADSGHPQEHGNCSNEIVNGSEIDNNIKPGIQRIITNHN